MVTSAQQVGWRRWLREPLALAVAFSLLLHAGGYGTYLLGKHLGWWQQRGIPAWLQALQEFLTPTQKMIQQRLAAQAQAQPPQSSALTFLDVDPLTATTPPEKPKFYGAVDQRAANPDQAKPSEDPNVKGREQPFIKVTEAKPKGKRSAEEAKDVPLQPSLSQPNSIPQPNVKESDVTSPTKAGKKAQQLEAGETRMAKAEPRTVNGTAEGETGDGLAEATQQPRRPRSLAEVKARLQGGDPAQRTQIQGGVSAKGRLGFDVQGSKWGAYDSLFIEAVKLRWFQILENVSVNQVGEVQLEFNLTSDGRITDMAVKKSNVNLALTLYCQSAIIDPSKYPEWPREMRREIGSDLRKITFTFHYLQ